MVTTKTAHNLGQDAVEERGVYDLYGIHKTHQTGAKKGTASHLLFSPELIENVLYLQFPVVLQGVEGVLRHLFLHLPLQGNQLSQDGAEIRSAVGVLVPALCHKAR